MVYAYTRFNLGDDLFIKLLCERYPNTLFVLYAPREYTFLNKEINNIKVYSSDSLVFRGINFLFRNLFKKRAFVRQQIAKSCDASVYIGGSIFMQSNKWKEEILSRKSMVVKGKPFLVLGANFGPYMDIEFYNEYKEIFKGYTDICFRDSYSYNLFSDLDNVRKADDIVFQLHDNSTEYRTDNNNIVISVIKPSYRKALINYNDDIYYNKIKEIIVLLIQKGYQVTLMSFCEFEHDNIAIKEIIALLPDKYKGMVNEFYYKHDIQAAIEVFKNSNSVIASRFHAMILGWVYNKSVFPLVYSKKMTNVMNDVGFNGEFSWITEIENVNSESVLKGIENNRIDVSNQVENSKGHFKELDKILFNN